MAHNRGKTGSDSNATGVELDSINTNNNLENALEKIRVNADLQPVSINIQKEKTNPERRTPAILSHHSSESTGSPASSSSSPTATPPRFLQFINRDYRKQIENKNHADEALDYVNSIENQPGLKKYRTYRLISSSSHVYKKRIVLTIGCQGSGSKDQEKVAIYLNNIVKSLKEKNIDVPAIIVLGDNAYENGIKKPDEPLLAELIKKYIDPIKTPNLIGIPFWYTQGNHDQGLDKVTFYSTRNFYENHYRHIVIGNNQTAATYLPNPPRFPTVQQQIAVYSRPNPDPRYPNEFLVTKEDLPHFNMPGRIYSLIIDNGPLKPNEGMEIFFLDSNSVVEEWLSDRKDSQIEWLKTKVPAARKAGFKVVLAQHHPLRTVGKRVEDDDSFLYINSTQKEEALRRLGLKKGNYNDILFEIMKKEGLVFDCALAAHDHCVYYHSEENLSQIISGGGGSERINETKNHYDFSKVPHAFYGYGCVGLETLSEEGRLLYSFFNLDENYVDMANLMTNDKEPLILRGDQFKNLTNDYYLINSETLNTYATPRDSTELGHVNELRNLVLMEIHLYFQRLNVNKSVHLSFLESISKLPQKLLSTADKDVKRAHNILFYLNRPHISSYQKTLRNILGMAGSDELFKLLDSRIKEKNLEPLQQRQFSNP